MQGVKDDELRTMLGTKYNDEAFLTAPPTVEQLRYSTSSFLRLIDGAKPNQLRTTGYAQKAPFRAIPTTAPNSNPASQNANPAPLSTSSPNNVTTQKDTAQRPVPPGITCFSCGKPGHFAVNCDQNKEQQKETLKALGCAPNQIEASFQGLEASNRMTIGRLVNGPIARKDKEVQKPKVKASSDRKSTRLNSSHR